MSTFVTGLVAIIVIGSALTWLHDHVEKRVKQHRIRRDASVVVGRSVVFRGRR